jgi:glycosyltransferase involved in cell wall biosynthesis
MDIVFIITSLDHGGAETQMLKTATVLSNRGWKVGIISLLHTRNPAAELFSSNVLIYSCSFKLKIFFCLSFFQTIFQLFKWKPTVVTTFNFPADAAGRIAAWIIGTPIIISSILTTNIKNNFRRLFYKTTESMIDVTISNSYTAVYKFINCNMLSSKKTIVIPNGLILSDFNNPPANSTLSPTILSKNDIFFWIAVGNARPAKDYSTLLRAVSLCTLRTSNFKVVIVGDGTALNHLKQYAYDLGISNYIQFLGKRTDVPQLLHSCDAFVLSSAWEGLPNAVMEGMAAGLPILSTDVGGVRELVENANCGLIVPPQNPEALAEKMLLLMSLTDTERHTLGDSGRKYAFANYNLNRIVELWETIFCTKLSSSTSRSESIFL